MGAHRGNRDAWVCVRRTYYMMNPRNEEKFRHMNSEQKVSPEIETDEGESRVTFQKNAKPTKRLAAAVGIEVKCQQKFCGRVLLK